MVFFMARHPTLCYLCLLSRLQFRQRQKFPNGSTFLLSIAQEKHPQEFHNIFVSSQNNNIICSANEHSGEV